MGMFDSFYDERGDEWQTKAYDCDLTDYKIGDMLSRDNLPMSYPRTYQVEILGGPSHSDSFATVQFGVLTSVNDPRNAGLPLINYAGHLVEEEEDTSWT